ncbi:MAG: TAXI family TRAP transporter solute-binding subunit [Natronospirillum sp.]
MINFKKALAAGAATAGLTLALAGSATANQFITIGTGGVTGVYYPVGGAICRLVNAGRADHGIRCSVESTGGSVFNVNTIRAGELDFGVVQSDVQFNAIEGQAQFENNAYNDLRAVFALHPEAFTVVARSDANARTFADLEGKRVNIGNPGSGQRATLDQLLSLENRDTSIFSQTSDLVAAQMASAMCDNQVDAIIYVVGHPSGAIQEATSTCSSNLVNVTGPAVQELLETFPYYAPATVPGGMYRGNADPVETFGVAATLVTSASTSDEAVYQLVKGVFDNLEAFRNLHPALSGLTREGMIGAGLSAPFHPGAERYYREIGLMD